MPYMTQEQIDEIQHGWADLIEQLNASLSENEALIAELKRIKTEYPDVV